MELKDFSNQLKSHSKQIDHLMRRRLPVIAGRMAKDFFQNSFRISAFVNGGVHHWQTTGRQLAGGKTAASRYGPLLSSRNHLFASIKYTPADYRVKVANDLLYAPIHNWGGTLHPSVTPKMRRFAWAMFYREAGIKRNASKKSKKKRTDEAAANPIAHFICTFSIVGELLVSNCLFRKIFFHNGNIHSSLREIDANKKLFHIFVLLLILD